MFCFAGPDKKLSFLLMKVHSSTKKGSQLNWYPNELIKAEHWWQCVVSKTTKYLRLPKCIHSNLNDKDNKKYKDRDKDKDCGFKDGKISPAWEVHPLESPLQVLILPFI